MSRTDHHRPYRVRAFFEGEIHHDHTSGSCRVETLHERGQRWGRHRGVCTKYQRVEYACPGFKEKDRFSYRPDVCSTIRREYYELYRQLDSYSFGDPARLLLRCYIARFSKRRFCGEPHVRYVRHNDWDCDVCDTAPTCYTYMGWKTHSHSHVPGWYVNETWTKPQRRRIRDELSVIKKQYNANANEADLDVDNRQHRHEARWRWA